MNCVLDAFLEHMEYLQTWYDNEAVKCVYYKMKLRTHNRSINVMTYAGIVPCMYTVMLECAKAQKVKARFQINDTYINQESLLQNSETTKMRIDVLRWWYNGTMEVVNAIDLQPAIYCMLNEQHAFFAVEPPDWIGARPIMAFQFSIKNE